MYKKTAKSTHYLPRKGSYSTHPHRNGRVEVLPPQAVDRLYDCAEQIQEATSQLAMLRMRRETMAQSAHMTAQIYALNRKFGREDLCKSDFDKDLRQVDEDMAALRRHIGTLKHLLGGGGVKTFDEAFQRVAKAELPPATYEALSNKAHVILAAARACPGGKR